MEIELSELGMRYAGLRVTDASRSARMRASLAADGQQSAVTVLSSAARSASGLVLIDGYLRVSALRALGRDVVEAMVVELSEADALIMAHRLDEVGRRSALEEGWLLEELMQRHGLEQAELGKRLSRSASWVSRRLSLVLLLPELAQRAVQQGRMPAQAAMKYLVPLSRDKRASCERIVSHLGHEPVTVREVGRLYSRWRTADAAMRQRIEQHPRLFLRAEEATQGDDKSDTQRLIAELEAISALCFRARKRLTDGAVDRKRPRLCMALGEAQRGLSTVTALMSPEDRDARSVHAHGDTAPGQTGPRSPHDRTDPGCIA